MRIQLAFYSALIRVRPALVTVALKKVLGIKRRVFHSDRGDFWIDPVSVFGLELQMTGEYEEAVTSALSQLLSPGCTFVDVGANEGYYSVLASHTAGRIVAVEPQKRLQSVIERNFSLNRVKGAQTVPYAISDMEGTAELSLAPDTNNGSSGISRATAYRVPTQTTRTSRLETMLNDLSIAVVDVMKMDIEGFEYEAILGSPSVFREHRVRALCLELHPTRLARRGLSAEPIVQLLQSCGYSQDLRFKNLVYRVN